MDKYRIIVAHPGQQHSYRLASALNRYGCLFSYITTVYNKKNGFIVKVLSLFISKDNKKRLEKRRCDKIDDKQLIQYNSLSGLILLLLNRVDYSRKIYYWWNKKVADSFGRKVAEYAVNMNADAVIMYDTNAKSCFEYLKEANPKILRIMDMSAANRSFVKHVYEEDMIRNPHWAEILRHEKRCLWDYSLEDYDEEIRIADFFLAASNVVKHSIEYSGRSGSDVWVVPYGVDSRTYSPPMKETGGAVRFLFVGAVRQMKGISYLLEAFEKVNPKTAQLEIVGDCLIPERLQHKDASNIKYFGYLLPEKVIERYKNADVFVFPSLCDGFGLAALEAMASGLPVICSDNSGVADLIQDGVNGFVVKTGDSEMLKDRIVWFTEHRDRMKEMKHAALETGRNYSWEKYEENIKRTIIEMIQRKYRNG